MIHNHNSINIEFSQNEIVDKKLIERLVNQSSVARGDLVYDIGAGSGKISEALLNKGARVIAIEKDKRKFVECGDRLYNRDKFQLYLDDFLQWEFPRQQKFKVFSSIPFFHTAEIINKLVFGAAQPEDCYLVVQKEAAEKFSGSYGDTLSSLLIKPMFWVEIIYYFRRTDFRPAPSVDVVLLQFEKRKCQLVQSQSYRLYTDFVVFCRERGYRTIKKSLKQVSSYSQMKRVFDLLSIDSYSSPSDLSFQQYLGLFQSFQEDLLRKKGLIMGTERELRNRQARMDKIHRTIKRKEI